MGGSGTSKAESTNTQVNKELETLRAGQENLGNQVKDALTTLKQVMEAQQVSTHQLIKRRTYTNEKWHFVLVKSQGTKTTELT